MSSAVRKTSSALGSIIATVKLLRTPDSVRTGGALIGALKVLCACFSEVSGDEDLWRRVCVGMGGKW